MGTIKPKLGKGTLTDSRTFTDDIYIGKLDEEIKVKFELGITVDWYMENGRLYFDMASVVTSVDHIFEAPDHIRNLPYGDQLIEEAILDGYLDTYYDEILDNVKTI